MKTRMLLMFGMPALLLGGTMVGCSASGHADLASAGSIAKVPDAGKAGKLADAARAAIAKHDGDSAVANAEGAVAASPQDATYRALLGQAYLAAGRFQSATQAFKDTLQLDPSNGRAALNLALAQTALGDWVGARQTLADNSDKIAPADRGLALALAGDPNTAIQLLSIAARDPAATAVSRQNFALALALGGHWQEARAVASVDLPPDQVDQRLEQWAAFARPTGAADQVAAMLGVVPAADQGQPVQLALSAPVPVSGAPDAALVAGGAPDAGVPAPDLAGAAGDVAGAPDDNVLAGAGAGVPSPVLSGAGVSFAPPVEVVQAVPPPVVKDIAPPVRKAAPKPGAGTVKLAVAKPGADDTFKPGKGGFYVQLGAYDNAAVARDAWKRLSQRTPKLADLSPTGMGVTVNGKAFYRLSVGGFARGDADKVCTAVKAGGGRCFVRADAGDKQAAWVKTGPQFAAR